MRLLFRDLVDDPEDLARRFDGSERVRYARGVQTIVWRIEHGPTAARSAAGVGVSVAASISAGRSSVEPLQS